MRDYGSSYSWDRRRRQRRLEQSVLTEAIPTAGAGGVHRAKVRRAREEEVEVAGKEEDWKLQQLCMEFANTQRLG